LTRRRYLIIIVITEVSELFPLTYLATIFSLTSLPLSSSLLSKTINSITSFFTPNNCDIVIPRLKRTTNKAKALLAVAYTAFIIEWPDELKVILIEIIRRYIKSRKITDNVFRKEDYLAIAIKL
jgi:hypothetical protein